MEFINIKNLNYYYPNENEKALDNINLNIEKGELVLITGKSGSSKSTLGKAITGAVPNFYGGRIGGEILINQTDIKELKDGDRAKLVTMVLQHPEKSFLMDKVHREIAFGLENIAYDEKGIKRRVFEALEFCNILDLAYRNIDTLSGGEKQKLAIAAALSYSPECIILDEPTSQLDPSAAEEIVNIIKKINKELFITIMVIEQRTNKWLMAADRVLFMENGKISLDGSREEFYQSKIHKYNEFLPSYLRLLKRLNIGYKNSLKEAKEALNGIKVNKIENKIYPGNTLISIKNLKAGYGDRNVLDGINLDIKQGDFLGIIGSNGAGKTTLLKSVLNLIPYKGSVKISGIEASKMSLKEIGREIGYISQNPNDYIWKDTVYEEVKFTLSNYSIEDEDLVNQTLKQLDIYKYKDKNPRDLSGGELQRLAMAAVLVLKPKILILDEITRGIDPILKKRISGLLKKINESGTTIIIVTHDIENAALLCKNLALIINGEIVSYGSRDQVLKDGIYYSTDINKLFKNNVYLEEEVKNV
ncbi:MAG: energy-coupling factor transporter ATPase [Clostridiaceae bacterium]